jgi:hypothetical protein
MARIRDGERSMQILHSEEEHQKFKMAAARDGVTLSEWVRRVCNTAASRSMLGVGPSPAPALEQRLSDLEKELHELKKRLASAFPAFLQLGEEYNVPEK